MRRKLDRATPEERERLERFLEWRRAEGREPRRLDWRPLASLAGVIVLTVVGVTLVASLPDHLRRTWEHLPSQRQSISGYLADRTGDSVPVLTPPAMTPPAVTPDAPVVEAPQLPERSAQPSDVAAVIVPSRRRTAPVTSGPPAAPPVAASAIPSLMPGFQDEAGRSEGVSSTSPPTPSTLTGAPPSVTPSLPPVAPATPVVPSSVPAEPPVSSPAAGAPGAGPLTALPSTPTVTAARAPTAVPAPPTATPALPVTPAPQPLPPTAATRPTTPAVPVPMPEVATKPFPQPIETVKRLIERLPEVKMGRALVRWVRSQPPADSPAQLPEPQRPQTQTR